MIQRVVDWWQYPSLPGQRQRRKMVKLGCGHVIGPVLWSCRMRLMSCHHCDYKFNRLLASRKKAR